MAQTIFSGLPLRRHDKNAVGHRCASILYTSRDFSRFRGAEEVTNHGPERITYRARHGNSEAWA